MQMRESGDRRLFWAALILFGLSLGWRLGINVTADAFHSDEKAYAVPGIERLAQGQLLIYCANSCNMAPLAEALSAPTVRLFGMNKWTLRWPTAFFSSLAVALLFVLCSRVLPFWQAIGVGLVLASPTSAIAAYSLYSIPEYSFGLLLAPLLLLTTVAVDRHRSVATWCGLGALGGMGLYIFPPSLVEVAAVLLWLGWRSAYGRMVQSVDWTVWRRIIPWLSACALLTLPLGYHWLTRAKSYHPGRAELAAWSVAGLLAAVTTWQFWRAFPPSGKSLLRIACCAGLMVLIPTVPRFTFEHIVTQNGQELTLRAAPPYQLKHAHEWRENAVLYGEYVLHQLFYGHYTGFMMQREQPVFTKRSLATALASGLVLAAAILAWRRSRADNEWREQMALLVLPLLLSLVLVSPSWLLFGDASIRYLYPYWWCIALLAWCGWPGVGQRPGLTFAQVIVLAGYILYAAWDCVKHLPLN